MSKKLIGNTEAMTRKSNSELGLIPPEAQGQQTLELPSEQLLTTELPAQSPESNPDEENTPIAAEDGEDDDDTDSAVDAGSAASSTMSLRSSLMLPHQENGRLYHGYGAGKYVLPSDEEENDRLDLQHHIFLLTFDGRLYTCPVDKEKQIHHTLDVGTGTGIWAIDFADAHPESKVLGVDLGANQPTFVPPNLSFLVDDLEDQWVFSEKFDFIHCRMMTGSIADWPRLFRQSYENLTSGGYLEAIDICFPGRVDDGSYPPDSALKKWNDLMVESAKNLGRYSTSAILYKAQMLDAGFENLVERQYPWPSNHWPKDPKFKELGRWVLQDIGHALSGISMALFTRGLGWSAAEVEVFLVNVRKEFFNPKIHLYFPIYVVYGRKPLAA